MCVQAWVMDAESFPFRPFAFATYFSRFQSRPWVLVQNFTEEVSRGGSKAVPASYGGNRACAAAVSSKLGFWSPALTEFIKKHGFQKLDLWLWEGEVVSDFFDHVQAHLNMTLAQLWFRAPVLPAGQ